MRDCGYASHLELSGSLHPRIMESLCNKGMRRLLHACRKKSDQSGDSFAVLCNKRNITILSLSDYCLKAAKL